MDGEGKFFFIRSELNDLVLDIKNGDVLVTTWEWHEGDNQIWFADEMRGVIRSKLDENFVLHIDGEGTLTVAEFHPDEYHQQWRVAGNVIRHRENDNWVLDIANNEEDEGARVCAWDYNEGDNQHWSINYLPPKRFYIRSLMHDKVLDVKRNDPSEGVKAVMWERNDDEYQENQLWYEDRYGNILSCLNDFAPSDDSGCLRMSPYDVEIPGVQWVKSGKRICRRDDFEMVWDIKANKKKNGAKVTGWEFHGGDNQQWEFDYIE